MKIHFNFYGVILQVLTEEMLFFEVINDLNEDFIFFSIEESEQAPLIRIELKPFSPVARAERGTLLFKNRCASVYGWGKEQIVDYGKEAWIRSVEREAVRDFELFCSLPQDAREFSYLTLLSSVGEALDKKGFHRIHALGLSIRGHSGLIPLPSGGGKSSLATLLSTDSEVKLFSDETPLISRDWIYPFPIRVALRPEVARFLNLPKDVRAFKRRYYSEKLLFPIDAAKVETASPTSFIIVGTSFNRENPTLRSCSKLRVLISVFNSMVVGIGVAQIAELMVRPSSIFPLIRVAFSRLLTAVRITMRSDCIAFDLARDSRENAVALKTFLIKKYS